MSSEATEGHPVVEAAAGRGHHHRLGLPGVRGHRSAENGLPGPAEPDDHRRRDRQRQGQRLSTSTWNPCRWTTKATYELLGRGTLGVFQRRRAHARPAAPHPTGFERRRRYRAVPARPDEHERTQRLCRPQEQPADHQTYSPGTREPLRGPRAERHYGLIVLSRADHAHRAEGATSLAADILRRPWSRRTRGAEEFEGFSDGMQASRFSPAAIKALWDTILPFADYAFSKSHMPPAAAWCPTGRPTSKANYPASTWPVC